jgi:sugar phosphate isomerase/epimerase
MRIGTDNFFQLTYCTNVHPSNGWNQVFANLQQYAPALKARFAPEKPFGIGLRLSGHESCELLEGDRLQEFHAYLDSHGLYVFTLNGFPYGPFHHQPVKANVHAPDWRDEERVAYTLRLARILAALLPEDTDGGISTNPLSYKPWIAGAGPAVWKTLTRNVVRVAEELARIRQAQGKFIHLDIEPEPDGLLENSVELTAFFQDRLLVDGAAMLADALDCSLDAARDHLREHIRVCLDTCHVALAYEEPAEVLERYAAAGIKLGKVQISSALRIPLANSNAQRAELAMALQPFVESTYLHQVVQRNQDGTLIRYPDLPDALPHIDDPRADEWRVHFHVPIFVQRYGAFFSTQEGILRTLALLHRRRNCGQLEIETYTWDVLPLDLKADLQVSISREYEWVLDVLG